MRLIEREEGALRGENMSSVNSADQSLFKDLHVLDEVVFYGRKLKMFRASRELKTVCESEVRLIRRLYVCVVGVLDRAESNCKTVQLVVGQKLLMKEVVTGSLAVLTFMALGGALLLILYRGLLLTILELHLEEYSIIN